MLEDPAALELFIAKAASDPDPASLLLQKRVTGLRHNCHFAAIDGELIAYFQQKVLRTDVHDGSGYCVEGITVAPDARLRELTARLARKLNYTGVGTSQFLVDEAGGEPCFLELNPRLDANCALPLYCGVDFPMLAVLCAKYRDGDTAAAKIARSLVPARYDVGRRISWLLGDVFGLMHALNHKLVSGRQALEWLGRILLSPLRGGHHVTWSLNNPAPTLGLLRARAQAVVKVLRRKLTVSRPAALPRPTERPRGPDQPSPSL